MTLDQQRGERVRSSRHDVVADAAILRALHVPGKPLLLANIWDPPTARTVESAGVRAIATASAALAPVSGYEDHGRLPVEIAFGALQRITEAVSLPVTADLEHGYGLSAEELIRRVITAGACGFNLEDTDHDAEVLVDADRQADRIAAIKAAARSHGIDLVVNARIDVQFHGRTVAEGLERARKYLEAGADCVYPILLADIAAIREYVAIGHTNILCRPNGLTPTELVAAGVSRISVGPMLFQLMLKNMRSAAEALCRLDDDALWRSN
jgi:2-methylisocitrate lyase-like PEP mutase family enzyme